MYNYDTFIKKHNIKGGKVHSAFFVNVIKGQLQVIIHGSSYSTPQFQTLPSIHAEHDAVIKLARFIGKTNRKQCYDLVVVSTTKTGRLTSSKPCIKCVELLKTTRNVRIRNVHYSTENGCMQIQKYKHLISDPTLKYSSGYYYKGF